MKLDDSTRASRLNTSRWLHASLVLIALLAAEIGGAQALEAARWKQDLAYLKAELPKRHKNLFHTVSRPAFEQALSTLEQKLDTMTDLQIRFALMQIVASVGDAHTTVVMVGDDLHRFPLEFWSFHDGIYLLAAPSEYRSAIGSRLIAINDTAIAQVESALAKLSSCENEPCRKEQLPRWLSYAEYLESQQIIDSTEGARFTFQRSDNPAFTLQVKARPASERGAPLIAVTVAPSPLPHQLWLKNQNLPYWYEYVPDARLLYVAFNKCRDDKSQPFDALQRDVLEIADTKPVDRFVVDLRRNDGGSEAVLRPLIRAIARRPALNRRGTLFALIGKRTFSSAASNAISFKEWTEATLVGEGTGQKPNSYGEVRQLSLPNSGLVINYSTKFWRRVDGDPVTLVPDVPVEQTFAKFAAGIDAAMAAVLSHIDTASQ
ncbi:MAG: hypothetical protein U0V87_02390 [Acidobacteriota bacterium]